MVELIEIRERKWRRGNRYVFGIDLRARVEECVGGRGGMVGVFCVEVEEGCCGSGTLVFIFVSEHVSSMDW